MFEDQRVNTAAEVGEKFIARDPHRTQDRQDTARRAHLITPREIHREIPHPVGFWDRKDVRVITKAPCKNASS